MHSRRRSLQGKVAISKAPHRESLALRGMVAVSKALKVGFVKKDDDEDGNKNCGKILSQSSRNSCCCPIGLGGFTAEI